VPDVPYGEVRLLAGPVNERLLHVRPSAGMLTVTVPSMHWRHSVAVTDGGGRADMRHAISA